MLDHEPPAAGVRIVPLNRLVAGGRWRTEAMRSYAQPLLYWFQRGQGRITVQGVIRGYGAHNAVLLPPRAMHGFDVTGTVAGYALFLPDDDALGLPDHPLHLRIREAQAQGELTSQVENIRAETERAEGASPRALAHHVGLLSVWLERAAGAAWAEGEMDMPAAQSLAQAYAALLERDFRTGAGVADYARGLGVTPAHLTRSCRQAARRSASDLLRDRVLYEARSLLSETRRPIYEIAAELGFSSAAYFTRAFQQRTGRTPSAYRREG